MKKTLHIVLLGLYEHDAIGNFTRAIATRMKIAGHSCAIYAQDHSPSLRITGTYDDFFANVHPQDVLLYKLSDEDIQFPRLMEAPCQRVVYYHNITPGHFFRPYDAGIADMLDRGRKSLHIVSQAHAVFANSAWSLEELRPYITTGALCGVMPPLTEAMFDHFEKNTWHKTVPDWLPIPYLLTIGRLVPHKNIAWGLKQFAALRSHIPNLTYAIVGGDGGVGTYAQELSRLASTLGEAQNGIRFVGEVTDEAAALWLHHATALLCVSRHEGFGVPLVEAMLQGVPVVALSQPAVNETLGGAGLILEEQNTHDNAMLMKALLEDAPRLARMRHQQLLRCAVIKERASNNAFWDALSV